MLKPGALGYDQPLLIQSRVLEMRVVNGGFRRLWLLGVLGAAWLVVGASPAAAQEEPPAPPSGTLRLTVKGAPATLYVDGKRMGRVPESHELELPAGKHTVELFDPAKRPYTTDITIRAGQAVELKVTMEDVAGAEAARPASREAAAAKGTLRLLVNGWADISVDGKRMGRVPPQNQLELPAGKHVLELTNPAVKPYKAVVTIPEGQTVEHQVRFERKQ